MAANPKNKFNIKNVIPAKLDGAKNVDQLVEALLQSFNLSKQTTSSTYWLLQTNARYCECHIPANKLVPLSTTDVPLYPEGSQNIMRIGRSSLVT